ncbi:MAG: nuclear transport factor 2 family protein [Actinomycetota bacterium]|nr:nuclear transport factor 2 family protein [Actinomycetota bacterium]
MILAQPTPEQVPDIIAITHLAAAYADAICRDDIDEAVLVYAEDGILRSPTTADSVGRRAIADTIRTATAGMDFVFQTVHQGLVRVEGDQAWARFPITEWGRRDDKGVQFLGMYEDHAIRTAQGWRFASRYLAPRTLGRPASFTGRIIDLGVLSDSPLSP